MGEKKKDGKGSRSRGAIPAPQGVVAGGWMVVQPTELGKEHEDLRTGPVPGRLPHLRSGCLKGGYTAPATKHEPRLALARLVLIPSHRFSPRICKTCPCPLHPSPSYT